MQERGCVSTNRLTLGDCSSRDSRQQKEEEREGEGAKMEVDGHDDSESVWL